jgi:predicted ATP-grasp superfamily ATP-dependent carboligase
LDPTIFSKYCTGFGVVPGIEQDPEKLKMYLQLLAKQLPRQGVLFPTGDHSVLTLSSIIHELDDYVSCIPEQTILETVVLKRKFYSSLRAHGVPHPMTLNADEIDGATLAGNISLPVFIRPSHSRMFETIFHQKGFVAHTVGEVRGYLQVAANHEIDVMVQEIIPGPTANGYVIKGYLDQRSEPLVLFASQKIRQPSMFSNTSVSQSIRMSDLADVSDVVIDYLKAIKYQGLFGAEIKQDARTGAFKLLEINARSMGGNYFPFACGVNTVLTAYLDSLGEDASPVMDYEVGVYNIALINDMRSLVRMVAKGHLSRETLLPYVRKKIWYMFSRDDPIPFVINLYDLLS